MSDVEPHTVYASEDDLLTMIALCEEKAVRARASYDNKMRAINRKLTGLRRLLERARQAHEPIPVMRLSSGA